MRCDSFAPLLPVMDVPLSHIGGGDTGSERKTRQRVTERDPGGKGEAHRHFPRDDVQAEGTARIAGCKGPVRPSAQADQCRQEDLRSSTSLAVLKCSPQGFGAAQVCRKSEGISEPPRAVGLRTRTRRGLVTCFDVHMIRHDPDIRSITLPSPSAR